MDNENPRLVAPAKSASDVIARVEQDERDSQPTLGARVNAAIADAGQDFLDAYRRSIIEHVGE